MNELVPTGTLRAGLAFAPEPSALFVVKDAAGQPRGVTVDLAEALGAHLQVPVAFMLAANTGLLTDAVESGEIDVAFMPVDEERKRRIAFGPNYFIVESTYLVSAGSGIETVEDADRPGVRLVGIANTTTIRAAARSLTRTSIEPLASIDEAMARMRSGAADGFALSHDALPPYQAALPGSRVATGAFQRTGIAVAVQKGRPQALDIVSDFMERAKADGTVGAALEAAGISA